MILSISGTRTYASAARIALCYVIMTIICAVFGAIYEIFSHEVYSFKMIYAFLFPLVGGALPFCLLSLKKIEKYPQSASLRLYHFGIATLTMESVVQGILDIYGTTNEKVMVYWIIGILLCCLGVIRSVTDCCTE